MDLQGTMELLSRTDIQPCWICVDAEPSCDLTATFDPASGGRITAMISGIPAGTNVKTVCLMSAAGDELHRWWVARVIADGDLVGVMLDSSGFTWSLL